jgi:metal-responsive CopG/Arc/MetJ family transcriptional regulator
MAKEIERAMKAEHRTRSEFVREALRIYLSARLIPPRHARIVAAWLLAGAAIL